MYPSSGYTLNNPPLLPDPQHRTVSKQAEKTEVSLSLSLNDTFSHQGGFKVDFKPSDAHESSFDRLPSTDLIRLRDFVKFHLH